MNRLERMNQIGEQYPAVVNRINEFSRLIADPSVNALSLRKNRECARENVISTMLCYPDSFLLLGKSMAEYTPYYRNFLVQGLNSTPGQIAFDHWYKHNWLSRNKPQTREAILQYNSAHFVQGWQDKLQQHIEPDWELLQEAHNIFNDGGEKPTYSLYLNLYHSLQRSTFEVFLDSRVIKEKNMGLFYLQ